MELEEIFLQNIPVTMVVAFSRFRVFAVAVHFFICFVSPMLAADSLDQERLSKVRLELLRNQATFSRAAPNMLPC